MDKRKAWLLGGLFVVALIIAFAVYKAASTKTVTVSNSTGGSSTTSTHNGLAALATPLLSFFGL